MASIPLWVCFLSGEAILRLQVHIPVLVPCVAFWSLFRTSESTPNIWKASTWAAKAFRLGKSSLVNSTENNSDGRLGRNTPGVPRPSFPRLTHVTGEFWSNHSFTNLALMLEVVCASHLNVFVLLFFPGMLRDSSQMRWSNQTDLCLHGSQSLCLLVKSLANESNQSWCYLSKSLVTKLWWNTCCSNSVRVANCQAKQRRPQAEKTYFRLSALKYFEKHLGHYSNCLEL